MSATHAKNTTSFNALTSATHAIGIRQPKPLRRDAETTSTAIISQPGSRQDRCPYRA